MRGLEASAPDLSSDLQAIARMAIVPNLLQVLCETTGMGFAAIARVVENAWVA